MTTTTWWRRCDDDDNDDSDDNRVEEIYDDINVDVCDDCLLYTSDAADE